MKVFKILSVFMVVGLVSACGSDGHYNNGSSAKRDAHSSVHTLPKYETRFQPKYYSENRR